MDFTFMFASVENGFASISLFASGLLASPIFKVGAKVFSIFGHAAAISLWLSNHRKTRRVIFISCVLIGCYLVVGCASPDYEKFEHSEGVVQDRGLYGGDYCAELRKQQFDVLREYKECVGGTAALLIKFEGHSEEDLVIEDECQQIRTTLSSRKDEHYRCVDEYRNTRYLFNPAFKFNVPEL